MIEGVIMAVAAYVEKKWPEWQFSSFSGETSITRSSVYVWVRAKEGGRRQLVEVPRRVLEDA